MAKPLRKGRGRAYWTGVVAEFERSGERAAEFCQRRSLSLSSMRQWLYRLRREQREGAPGGKAKRFVPLVAAAKVSGPSSADACRVRAGGVEVTFVECPPASYVAELLRLMDR